MPLGAALAGAISQLFGLRAAFAAGALGMAFLIIPFLRNITPAALGVAEAAQTGSDPIV